MVYVNRRLLGQQRDKLFREALRMQLAQAGENLKALREIADVLIAEAKAGNIRAIEEIADRLDGKPAPQMPDLSGNGGEQMRRTVIYQIIHTTEERLEAEKKNKGLLVDYSEGQTVNGNGHDSTDGESSAEDGNEQRE